MSRKPYAARRAMPPDRPDLSVRLACPACAQVARRPVTAAALRDLPVCCGAPMRIVGTPDPAIRPPSAL